MKLTYKAVAKDGRIQKGILDANSPSEAASYLKNRGLFPIDIRDLNKKDFSNLFSKKKKIKQKEIVLFTRQIASMLAAGITLIRALEIYQQQIKNPALVDLLSQLQSEIQEGSTFSDAVAKRPEIFPTVYVSLVRAGEASGLFDKILNRLADNLEKQQKLKSMVKSALLYPAIVIIMMVIVIVVMMVFVIPQLTKVYVSLNVALPLPTRIVIGLSNFTRSFLPLIIGFILILYVAFKRWHKTEKGKEAVDRFKLHFPLFGKITRGGILTEFSRTLGLLVGTGTLVVDALNQTAEITGNYVYEKAIKDVAKRVEKGVPVGEALSVYPLFPPLLVQLTKIGEQTGKMDETLSKASEYFENDVNGLVKTLTTAMEPLIMLVLGGIVAFLLISVVTPIYKISSSF